MGLRKFLSFAILSVYVSSAFALPGGGKGGVISGGGNDEKALLRLIDACDVRSNATAEDCLVEGSGMSLSSAECVVARVRSGFPVTRGLFEDCSPSVGEF